MKNEPSASAFPRRAFLVSITSGKGYGDAVTVVPCSVLGLEPYGHARVAIRVGARVENKFVAISELASTETKALLKLTELLHALAARPLPHDVAGMTTASASAVSPAEAGVDDAKKVPAAVGVDSAAAGQI